MDKTAFGWTTLDEMATITFMGSAEQRENGTVPTKRQRIEKLRSWLRTHDTRRWNRSVKVSECVNHAITVLQGVIAEPGH